MIRFKHVYQFDPQQREAFSRYFKQIIVPEMAVYHTECYFHGLTEEKDELFAIWQTPDEDMYLRSMEWLRNDEQIRQLRSIQTDRIEKASNISAPQYAAVTAFVTNELGEVLLVRNLQRKDTWELPGGRVEMNETLEQAVVREIQEETGATIEITGVIGVYQNFNKGIIISFSANYVSGELQSPEEEIMDVRFVDLRQIDLDEWFTRPHFKTRVTDALKGYRVPYESYAAKPYALLSRLEADEK